VIGIVTATVVPVGMTEAGASTADARHLATGRGPRRASVRRQASASGVLVRGSTASGRTTAVVRKAARAATTVGHGVTIGDPDATTVGHGVTIGDGAARPI